MNLQRSRRVYPASAVQTAPSRQSGEETAGVCPEMPSLAMVYAPPQRFEELNEPGAALRSGSLFRALVMPFAPTGGKGRCGV